MSHHCQRVTVDRQVSSWKTLCGSLPQRSRIGLLSFIVLIDDLKAACEVSKFYDLHPPSIKPLLLMPSFMFNHAASLDRLMFFNVLMFLYCVHVVTQNCFFYCFR